MRHAEPIVNGRVSNSLPVCRAILPSTEAAAQTAVRNESARAPCSRNGVDGRLKPAVCLLVTLHVHRCALSVRRQGRPASIAKVVVVPSFALGRVTVYNGHLFVRKLCSKANQDSRPEHRCQCSVYVAFTLAPPVSPFSTYV